MHHLYKNSAQICENGNEDIALYWGKDISQYKALKTLLTCFQQH